MLTPAQIPIIAPNISGNWFVAESILLWKTFVVEASVK